jgi:predicted phage terminase large subunit-like protein
MEWIPKVSPELMSPHHLAPAADYLQHFRVKPFKFVFSVPPRHGKTILVLHWIVWAMKQDPTLRIAYVTFAQSHAEDMQGDALRIAERAGLELTRTTMEKWETPEGGKVFWVGIGGAITGKGFNCVVIDDPHKNRVEAESPTLREKAWDALRSDLVTRMQRGGRGKILPSICIIQTRWHHDDLAGRCERGDEAEGITPWPCINIPAVLDEGTEAERALFPEHISLEMLKGIRATVGPYSWASLYQGHPVPRGSTVFGDPTFFAELPAHHQLAQGLDLSYTAKKTADYSVVVTMMKAAEAGGPKKGEPLFFVVRCFRAQKRAPDFKADLRQERSRAPRSRCRIYAAGTELGAIDFLKKADIAPDGKPIPGIQFEVVPPRGDKFTRAIPLAATWNAGRVLVPSPELVAREPLKWGWVNDYLDELKAFTGVLDANDDQVDASVASYDILAGAAPSFSNLPEVSAPRRM